MILHRPEEKIWRYSWHIPSPSRFRLATNGARPDLAYLRRGERANVNKRARAAGWYAVAWTLNDPPVYFGPFRSWVGAARFQRRYLDVAAARHASFAPPWWYLEPAQWPRNPNLAFRMVPKPQGQLFPNRPRRGKFGRESPLPWPWKRKSF